jgi:hypothetical protein
MVGVVVGDGVVGRCFGVWCMMEVEMVRRGVMDMTRTVAWTRVTITRCAMRSCVVRVHA